MYGHAGANGHAAANGHAGTNGVGGAGGAAAQPPPAPSGASIDGLRTTKWAVFLLAFSSVFREGTESVLFLAGVSGAASPTAIPLSAVVGIILGCLVGVALYYSCAALLL